MLEYYNTQKRETIIRSGDFARLRLEKTNVNARFEGAHGMILSNDGMVELATSINQARGGARIGRSETTEGCGRSRCRKDVKDGDERVRANKWMKMRIADSKDEAPCV
jgi:hypothetical protein